MTTRLFASSLPGFDDPLAMLRACHDRIRDKLTALDRLRLHVAEDGCDAGARTAARNLLKYFDTAAPNHDADEERSLFPRLLTATSGSAAPLIERLHAEHTDLAALWSDLRPDLAAIEAGQRSVLTPHLVRRIRTAYLSHLECEESKLFPPADERLDSATRATIGAEMAARRSPKTAPK